MLRRFIFADAALPYGFHATLLRHADAALFTLFPHACRAMLLLPLFRAAIMMTLPLLRYDTSHLMLRLLCYADAARRHSAAVTADIRAFRCLSPLFDISDAAMHAAAFAAAFDAAACFSMMRHIDIALAYHV